MRVQYIVILHFTISNNSVLTSHRYISLGRRTGVLERSRQLLVDCGMPMVKFRDLSSPTSLGTRALSSSEGKQLLNSSVQKSTAPALAMPGREN